MTKADNETTGFGNCKRPKQRKLCKITQNDSSYLPECCNPLLYSLAFVFCECMFFFFFFLFSLYSQQEKFAKKRGDARQWALIPEPMQNCEHSDPNWCSTKFSKDMFLGKIK